MDQIRQTTLMRAFCVGASLLAFVATNTAARAESGFSGMQLQGMDERIALALGMKESTGVLVRDVALSGPAGLGGVQRGDLIVKYADADIKTFKQLVEVAQNTSPGQKIGMDVIRAGKRVSLSVTLGEKPESWKVSQGSVVTIPAVGVTLASVTPKIRERFNLRWGATGVLVTLVDEEHAKTQILERGDMIAQVNQQDIWNPKQVAESYEEAKEHGQDRLLLLVERLGNFKFLLLPVK